MNIDWSPGNDDYWIFSDGQSTSEYCRDCAVTAWRDFAVKTITTGGGDPNYQLSELREHLPEDFHTPPNRGAVCDSCHETIAPACITCEGCGNFGSHLSSAFSTVPDTEINWDADSPTSNYCDDCAAENGGETLLGDDGRGYRLSYHKTDGTYRAGCRVFFAFEALRHWSDANHDDPEAAGRLYRAVLAHWCEHLVEVPA